MSTPVPQKLNPEVLEGQERMPDVPLNSLPVDRPASGDAPADQDNAPTVISKTVRAGGNGQRGQIPNLLRGRKLAHFELIEPIGVGGMAAVIKARDTQLDRQVALKILPPDMAGDSENVRRFENEARAAAKLDHENIARVYYFGCDQGLHFIAFEFVEGKNLRILIEELGRIPIAESVHYVLQIAAGLAHAAQRGVVHRDIKPSNIIVDDAGRAKLVDMGLARSTEARSSDALTQSGVTLGTFDYISPEQALEPRQADCRSDIYSLGCTLYHMVTGVPPVPEGTAARKLQFHQNEAPIDPRQLNESIPDELAAILSMMMAKDPRDRYQQPELLVQHLLALARKLQGPTGPYLANKDVLFVDSILPNPPAIRPWWVLGIGAAVLVLMIGVIGPLLNSDMGSAAPSGWLAAGDQPREDLPPAAPQREPLARPDAGGVTARPLEAVLSASVVEAATEAELQAALAPRQVRTIKLTSPLYDLSGTGRQPARPIHIADGDFTIEAKKGIKPVIQLSAPQRLEAVDRPMTGLTGIQIDSGVVTLRGLRFELAPSDAVTALTALVVSGGQVNIEDCEFRESGARLSGNGGPTVLRVPRRTGSGQRVPSIFFKRCVLWGGYAALALDEGAAVSIEDCLVGPYEQPVQVGNRGRGAHQSRASITIASSSWLLGPVPCIQVDSQQSCQLNITQSIFSQPDRLGEAPLLLLGSQQLSSCRLQSSRNYFHNVTPLVAARNEFGGEEPIAAGLGDFAKRGPALVDLGSRADSASPWESPTPLKLLKEGDALAAARLNPELANLRLSNDEVIGPRQILGQQVHRALPPLAAGTPSKPAGPKELIVDGQGSKPGTYKTLASALGDADADAEIVVIIRLNGALPIRSLDVGSRKVTLRAGDGFTPELTFNPEQVPTGDGEAILFRLHDGEIHFDQVALRLAPLRERDATKLQALIAISGTGRARLKNCLVTLNEDPSSTRTGLAALADPTGSMMGGGGKPPRPGQPSVELENCLVRGGGDLVLVRASRPFQLDVKNALVAIAGSLLTIDGNRPEASFPSDGAQLTMERVTAYLGQSLVQLRATLAQPTQVPLRVNSATSCVFVSAYGNPLVRVEGPQSEDDLKRRLYWQGRRNFYSPASAILLWQSLQKDEMPHKYGSERWGELWGRSDDLAGFAQSIQFAGSPLSDRMLSELVPADFRILGTDPPELDLGSRGADLELLPLSTLLPLP